MPRGEIAPLRPEAYFAEAWHDREMDTVFRDNWLYAGTTADLAKEGDWVSVTYGNRSWIILRSAGGLRCFRNVCSHRHSRITTAASGCGPLRCRYHGWTYDTSGIPVGLPGHRDNFDLTPTERQGLKLREGIASSVGNFEFFRDNPKSGTAESELDPSAATLFQNLSETFCAAFLSGQYCWKANWKAGVENTLEPYHAGFIHAESLAQVIHPACEQQLARSFSSHFHRLREPSAAWWKRMVESAGLMPSPHYSDYWHFHVYPNLCIGLTFGSLLSIQTFEPISPKEVVLRFRLFLPTQQQAAEKAAMRKTLQRFLCDFNEQILNEDREPVEACQQGYGDASTPSLLGESEARIGGFQRRVVADIGTALYHGTAPTINP